MLPLHTTTLSTITWMPLQISPAIQFFTYMLSVKKSRIMKNEKNGSENFEIAAIIGDHLNK